MKARGRRKGKPLQPVTQPLGVKTESYEDRLERIISKVHHSRHLTPELRREIVGFIRLQAKEILRLEYALMDEKDNVVSVYFH